jgi:hypothetical protein
MKQFTTMRRSYYVSGPGPESLDPPQFSIGRVSGSLSGKLFQGQSALTHALYRLWRCCPNRLLLPHQSCGLFAEVRPLAWRLINIACRSSPLFSRGGVSTFAQYAGCANGVQHQPRLCRRENRKARISRQAKPSNNDSNRQIWVALPAESRNFRRRKWLVQ